MNTPPELEKVTKIEEMSQKPTEKAQTVLSKSKNNDKRKLLIAALVLSACAALTLSQAVPLFRDGLMLGNLSFSGTSSQPEADFFTVSKKDALRDEGAANSVDQPMSTTGSDGAAKLAREAPAVSSGAISGTDKTLNEGLTKDSAMKEKAANMAVLTPLGDTISPQTRPDLGHGYNAPAFLIKQAHLQLEVGSIQESFGKIAALTEKYHGYLVDSSLNNYENSQPGAELHLKLPSDKLSAALAELDALGTVRSKQIKTEDIWLQLKSQQLNIDHLKGQTQAIKPGNSQREQQYQIKQQQLEQLRLEQMLKMATVNLNLAERAPFWDLRPLGEELRSKSFVSLQSATRLLAQVVLFLPPVVIFLGFAWLGWLLIRKILVDRLALLSERVLSGIYVAGLIFFPLSALGPRGLGPVILFSLLLGSFWSAKTVFNWIKARNAEIKTTADAPAVSTL